VKDLGIQSRTIDAARDFLKRAPTSVIAPRARSLITAFELHGGFHDSVAEAADDLCRRLQLLDTDSDGDLSREHDPASQVADGLYHALLTNDCEGNDPEPTIHASVASLLSKPSGIVQPVTPRIAFASLNRRVIALTLWSSRGARYAFEQSRETITRTKPDAVVLHTDPVALTRGGAQLAADVRAAFPGLIVCWAIYGDSYGPDPSRVWAACARAAEACGVETLMVDAEVAWKTKGHGATLADRNAVARKAVRAMRLAAPTLHISHTSYDGPVSIVRPDGQGRWGGHQSYSWEGFLGDAAFVQASAYQVYIGGGKTEGDFEAAKNRQARHEKSLRAAVKLKLVAPETESWQYLQVHNSSPAAVCYLSERRRVTCCWASPTRVSPRAVAGMQAAVFFARERMTVAEFQAAHGLTNDGDAGEKTFAALGIPWIPLAA
jgi:hypothetical protein